MHPEALRRKARFRAALTLAGETARGFAEKQGVTPQHLSFVLAGTRESARLIAEVERFIGEHGDVPRARVRAA